MKRIIYVALAALVALVSASCARDKIIPDTVLAEIFRDAFLTNAYLDENRRIKVDSLRIYEPIFEKYGYTTEDVINTVGNFSRRKSARLGDVVELSIAMLEEEGKVYNREVAVLDTINAVARRTFTRKVMADTLIRFERLKDTSKVYLCVDVHPGKYTVSYDYTVGKEDKNEYNLRSEIWLERDSSRVKYNMLNNSLNRFSEGHIRRDFHADSTHRRLRMRLVTIAGKKPQKPSVEVRNFEVKYVPETAAAVDSLYEKQLGLRIFADTFLETAIRAAERKQAAKANAAAPAEKDASPKAEK